MNRKQFLLTLLLANISAFLGGTFGVWLLMPLSVLAQDEVPKVIEAQEFRVVDDRGIVRAQLSVSGDMASLRFAHPTGDRPMLEIKASRDLTVGSSLVIRDSQGNERATLGFGEDLQLSYLSLDGSRTTAGTGTPAEISLRIIENYAAQMLSGSEARLTPELTLRGAETFSSINLEVPTDGPMLSLYDEDLELRAVLGSMRLQNTRTGSTEIRAPSSLLLFDEEGKVVWSAP